MTDYHRIYATQADLYDWLVSREDYQGNLLNVIRYSCDLRIYELTGT